MRGMRKDRRQLGSSSNVPAMRRNVVLRQLAEQAREQTRARKRTSGDRIRSAGGAVDVLLPGRRVLRILKNVGDSSRPVR